FFLITLTSLSSFAQRETYFVGDVPVAAIESEFLEVAFCGIPFRPGENMAISYGQPCLAANAIMLNRGFLLQCNGVKDDDGKLVVFNDYIAGLNYIKQQGWELMEVMENASDGSSSPRSSKFLFKRAYDSRATVKVNQGK
ncbi:MAG: hypothetical protein AAFR59_19895, partial [Bacteroidota bacterium]